MALILVVGALIAHSAMRPNHGMASQGILGGPTTAVANDIPVQATFIGVPQVVSSAEAAVQSGVTDRLSTPVLSDAETFVGASEALKSLVPPGSATVLDTIDDSDEPVAKAPVEPSPKPATARYFIQPTSGLDWGILHGHNAVDIANVCGTPVLAAAPGVVIDGDGSGSWNGGYGNFLFIQHPNGTKTKYAHLRSLEVSVGDEVSRGQEIGIMGTTGHSTGCHLHFEVYGAANPFAKR